MGCEKTEIGEKNQQLGGLGERAEQQERGRRRKPVAQTQEKNANGWFESFVNQLFIHPSPPEGIPELQGQLCPPEPPKNPPKNPRAEAEPGARLCSEMSTHTQGCAQGQNLSAKPASPAHLAPSKPSLAGKWARRCARSSLSVPPSSPWLLPGEGKSHRRDTTQQNNTEQHEGKEFCYSFKDKIMTEATKSWEVDNDKGFFSTPLTPRGLKSAAFWDKFEFQPPDNTALHSYLVIKSCSNHHCF